MITPPGCAGSSGLGAAWSAASIKEGHPRTITPVPGYWGRKGSTFVDYVEADDELLRSLLHLAWAGVAPRRLQRPA